MEDWKEFLSSNEILKADESNDPYSWTIYYKMEEGQIQNLSNTSSNDSVVTFRDGFTQEDDLSLWRNVSQFFEDSTIFSQYCWAFSFQGAQALVNLKNP